MTKSTVAETILRYRVDSERFFSDQARVRESLVATLDETKKRAVSLEEVGKQINRVFAEGIRSQGLEQIIADFRTAEAAGMDTADSLALVSERLSVIGASEDEVRRVASALMEQADATERVADAEHERTSGGGLNVGRIGSTATQVLSGIGADGNAAGLIGDVAEAFTELTPVGLALTATLGGLSVIASAANTNLEAANERADAFFNRTRSIAELVTGGSTSADIEDVIRVREQELESINAQIDGYQSLIDMFNRANGADEIAAAYDALERATGGAVLTQGALRTEYDNLTEQAQSTSLALDDLYLSLGDTRVAANDAAAAERERQSALSAESVRTTQLWEFERTLDDMTRIEREALRERLSDQQSILLYLSGTQYGEELAKTEDELVRVTEQIRLLGETSDTTADQMERGAALRAQAEARQQAAEERRGDAMDQYLDATEALADAQAERADAQMALADLEREHSAELIDITNEKNERIADAESTAADARIELADQLEKERLRIERKSGAAILTSIGERDTLANWRAKQNQKEQLDDLADSEKERRKRIDASYERQMAAAESYAAKAFANEESRYNKSLSAQLWAGQQAQMLVENAILNEKALREYGAQLSVSLEGQRQSAINSVMASGMNESINMASTWAQMWLSAQNYGFTGSPNAFDFTGMTASQVQAGVMANYNPSITVNAPVSVTAGGDAATQAATAVRDALRIALRGKGSGGGSAYR